MIVQTRAGASLRALASVFLFGALGLFATASSGPSPPLPQAADFERIASWRQVQVRRVVEEARIIVNHA